MIAYKEHHWKMCILEKWTFMWKNMTEDFKQRQLSCASYYLCVFLVEQRVNKYTKPLYAHGQRKNNTANHMHMATMAKCKEGQTYNYVMGIVESTTSFVKTTLVTPRCAVT